MLKVAKERILEKLNAHTRDALTQASEFCISQSGYEVSIGHYLLALLEQPANDVNKIISYLNLSHDAITANIRKSFDHIKRGSSELPQFSPMLLELLQDAYMVSSAELSEQEVRSGSVWVATANNPDRYCHFYFFKDFESLDAKALIQGFSEVTRGSMESVPDKASQKHQEKLRTSESALAKFGRDIIAQATEGKIDPVFCREVEISLITDILCRRRKNNPILVGDAGVGKTAIAEGLALKIIEGDVPDALKDAKLWELDLGALQAGASVKGEFERRLKGVLDEVLNAAEKIILFIDEAHNLIGGGGQVGGGDAANLLKPALARGELRAIAATTWSEYKKYFEKDPALTRRFQLIKLDEPSPDETVTILRGLRSAYEETHNVYISDAALIAAAHLSSRYLTGRQLPDKAFDILDTACVRVGATQTAKPTQLDILEKKILATENTLKDRKRDVVMKADGAEDVEAQELETLEALRKQAENMSAGWSHQCGIIDQIISLRSKLSETTEHDNADTDESTEDIQEKIEGLLEDLRSSRDTETTLVHFEVGADVISDVISDWTGIPVSAMSNDDAAKVITLGENLKSSIKGQDGAIDIVHDRLKSARLDFIRPNLPQGAFLLVGPSGVGKTETALQVAEFLYGGKQFLTVINMSEYQEKHTVSRLIGSPPGYVGYGEGGVLTEAIRKKPYSVVLLDEVEKAHPDVMNIFYQAFDRGEINDGEGREIDCKNIVFFMTSNLGSEAILQNKDQVDTASMEALEKAIRPHLEAHLKPALLARMRILCYKPLNAETLNSIIEIKLDQLAKRLKATRNLSLTWTAQTLEQISALCAHTENGARMIEQVIDRWILPPISDEALLRISEQSLFDAVKITARDGGFELTFFPDLDCENHMEDQEEFEEVS